MTNEDVHAFWNWFSEFSAAISSKLDDKSLLSDLDACIHHLNPRLSWEVGPGIKAQFQLVISPDLSRDLRDVARTIVAQAPSLPSWEFYASRQPKQWDFRLTLNTTPAGAVSLDASRWKFVLLRHKDGTREVLLRGAELPDLTDEQRWYAAAVVLESVLGEESVLDNIDEFELVHQFEANLEQKARPVNELKMAFPSKDH